MCFIFWGEFLLCYVAVILWNKLNYYATRRMSNSKVLYFAAVFFTGPLILHTRKQPPPHQKYTRGWVLDWTWNTDSDISSIFL